MSVALQMHNDADSLRPHYTNVTDNYKTEYSRTSFFEMSWIVHGEISKPYNL